MDIQQIELKIEEVRHSLNQEYQRGAIRDEAKIADLQKQLDELTKNLEEQQRSEQHKERIVESHEEIAYILDNLTVDGISMRELCYNGTRESAESAYQLLRSVVQETMMEREEKLLGEINSLKGQINTAKAEKETTQKQYDDLYEVSAKQRNEINTLKAQLEDAEHKRDAAASELEEYKAEVARLNSQVDDLRKEIAVGAVNAVKVVNVQESLENYKKQKELEANSRPAIYNLQPLDAKRSRYKAILAETDEPIEFGWLEKEKYREVTAEEAELFRRRKAEESQRGHEDPAQSGNSVEEGGLVPPSLQFQEDDEACEDTANGLDEGNIGVEVAGKSVEERITALEQRVAALEGMTKGEAA